MGVEKDELRGWLPGLVVDRIQRRDPVKGLHLVPVGQILHQVAHVFQSAAASLKEAADALRGKKEKKRGKRGLLLIVVGGTVAALILSEGLRKKVLDALFGAEEEFEYTSTTSSPSSTPAGVN